MTKAQQADQQEAITRLREMLKPGDQLNLILRHVSRSGMRREISVLQGEYEISHLVARALGMNRSQQTGGIKTDGCGMDMGFALVYDLSSLLYDSGWECIGDKCRASEHFNDPKAQRGAHVTHTDGGYALKHNWL